MTHILLGASVAQLPGSSANSAPAKALSFKRRALIGGAAALFPDIDYLLFLWHPLEFLAYWHRAETHSLMLAPFWAILLSMLYWRFSRLTTDTKIIFWIVLLAICSHALADSLTTYGTQWFAPLSTYRISWNLLFVVDGYFTLCVLISLVWLATSKAPSIKCLALAVPLGYIAIIGLIKYEVRQSLVDNPQSQSDLALLPQPFSPWYWHAVQADHETLSQAYVALNADPIAKWISTSIGKSTFASHYQTLDAITWTSYSLWPTESSLKAAAEAAWRQESFQAFRNFAVYPVFYEYQLNAQSACFWFSDLRYHWPEFTPSFRYGMCRDNGDNWQLYRKKYLSEQAVRVDR